MKIRRLFKSVAFFRLFLVTMNRKKAYICSVVNRIVKHVC